MLKRFSKDYPLIVATSIVSAVVIIAYSIFETSITCQSLSTVANILFQLSIGIIVNAVFFYTQIYLAQKKQREYADKCIVKRIETIQGYMKDIFRQLGKLYIEGYREGNGLTAVELKEMVSKLNTTEYVNVIDPRKTGQKEEHYTVKEWIINEVEYVERDIDRLSTYYAQYVSPELSEVLDQILASNMHNLLCRSIFHMSNGTTFRGVNQDVFFAPYYELIGKLEQQKKMYE